MRECTIKRETNETKISLGLNLDGSGAVDISADLGFLGHMLELLAHHSGFDIKLACSGDYHVDWHHITEDIGITLGRAFARALGDRADINRYGSQLLPMDEALALVALDCGGRGYLAWDVQIPAQKVGNFDTELVQEFFLAITREAGLTLHIRLLTGQNSHHIIEAVFKGFARALKQAVASDMRLQGDIPSSKGLVREEIF